MLFAISLLGICKVLIKEKTFFIIAFSVNYLYLFNKQFSIKNGGKL